MKTYLVLVLSMVAMNARADVSPCLKAAQEKGQVIYSCSEAKTERTVIITQDSSEALNLTFCKTLSTGIEFGAVEKVISPYFYTYSTPKGIQGDATYELKTDNWGSHFTKFSEGDSQDFDMTCGKVGSL